MTTKVTVQYANHPVRVTLMSPTEDDKVVRVVEITEPGPVQEFYVYSHQSIRVEEIHG